MIRFRPKLHTFLYKTSPFQGLVRDHNVITSEFGIRNVVVSNSTTIVAIHLMNVDITVQLGVMGCCRA